VEFAVLIVAVVIIALVALMVTKTVRIVPQARARNIERFGRYRKTLEPGMNFIIPFVDRVKPLIDLREQVVAFKGQPVITEDNLVVHIDTVLFFQVTDPRAADYEIVNYIQAIEQITATMLRSVIGNMDLEETLTSRDKINMMLRGVLDDASGKWGLRVTRVEIKAIDPPRSVIDAMEKQMRAEREKRAAILTAEGVRQSKILTAEGEKQSQILRAEGDRQGQILRSEGQAQAIGTVFQAVHDGDANPQVLAYQYLQTLPQLAQAEGNTFWVIPSEVTTALRTLSTAFGGAAEGAGTPGSTGVPAGRAVPPGGRIQMPGAAAALTGDAATAGPAPNGEAARAAEAAQAREAARAAEAASARDEVVRVEREVAEVEREVAEVEREVADAEQGTGHAGEQELGEPARDVRT
jgi:regulator of protease activity HflC (stomatin/prohibitin superfamily)